MNLKNEEAMILSAVKKLLKDTHFVALLIFIVATVVVTYFKGANGQLSNLENLFTDISIIIAALFGVTLTGQTLLPQVMSFSGSLRASLLQLFEEAVATLLEQQSQKANITVSTGTGTANTGGTTNVSVTTPNTNTIMATKAYVDTAIADTHKAIVDAIAPKNDTTGSNSGVG